MDLGGTREGKLSLDISRTGPPGWAPWRTRINRSLIGESSFLVITDKVGLSDILTMIYTDLDIAFIGGTST